MATGYGYGMWTEEGQSRDDMVRDKGDVKVCGKCSWMSGVNVQTGGIGMTLSLQDEREHFFFFKCY